MTVVAWQETDLGTAFDFIASAESLGLTTLDKWAVGQTINLERAR